ncbi:13531_t:CDS:2, partial [Entrophospora sp. SA101]
KECAYESEVWLLFMFVSMLGISGYSGKITGTGTLEQFENK